MTFFPTNHYPGIYWPGSRQVEAQLPVTAAPPFFDQLTADNIAASGIRETIVLRSEERRQLTFFGLDALETAQWGQYFTERGGRGQQAELMVDRFTGRVFTFANTTADQNTETSTTGIAGAGSYQMVDRKLGLVIPLSRNLLMSANVGSVNASLTASEGTIVVTLICSFAGNDAVNKFFVTWAGNFTLPGIELVDISDSIRIRVRMQNERAAVLNISWPSGTKVSLIGQWTMGASAGIWLIETRSGQTTTTTYATVSLSGETVTTGVESRITVSGALGPSDTLPGGVLLHFATYKKAFADPTVLLSHFPLGRNYYSRAEVIERTFNPTHISPGVDAWQWTWTFRQGF